MKRFLHPLLVVLFLAGCAADSETGRLPAVDTGVDPATWVTVPAGEFLMGQHKHPTAVEYNYQIMVTDVTNAQYAAYLNAALAAGAVRLDGTDVVGHYSGDEFHSGGHEFPIEGGEWLHVPLGSEAVRLKLSGYDVSVLPSYENHPMIMVTWFGARAYCEQIGGRLPTEVEWEKSARGTDGRPFPWGDQIERNHANYYSSHDLFEKLNSGFNTTPVGFFNGRTYDGYQTLDAHSPYGLYDMAGNVWQWTGDVYAMTHLRYMRGGSKADYGYNLRVWMRNSAGPDYASPNVGFRCAK